MGQHAHMARKEWEDGQKGSDFLKVTHQSVAA